MGGVRDVREHIFRRDDCSEAGGGIHGEPFNFQLMGNGL